MDLLARVAALEAAVFGKAASDESVAPVPVRGDGPDPVQLRGYEEIPISFVDVGFSRDKYILRPERFPNEPAGDRLVPRGDLSPTTYTYDSTLPPDVRVARWEAAGRPTRDSLGRLLDVRGVPVTDGQQFSPSRP